MSSSVPSWTDFNAEIFALIVAPTKAPDEGLESTATVALQGKYGAWLWFQAGRTDNVAITGNPVRFNVRRGSSTFGLPNSPFSRVGGNTTAVATTVDTESHAADLPLNVTDTTGFTIGDYIAIMTAGPSVTNLEFHRISRIDNAGASGELVLDTALEFLRPVTDIVTNQADLFQMWLPGGANYEIGIDYGGCSAGPSLAARVFSQIWNNITTT